MDLKVVGAGQLGMRVAILWKESFPEASVTLKTKHENIERSEKWKSMGFDSVSEEEYKSNPVKAPFVVFCAPPTNNPNYVTDIEISIQTDWDTKGQEKCGFVFTGSGGVYAENSGGDVNEDSEILSNSIERHRQHLLSAESIVEQFGGVIIRLGALYTKTMGPHSFWLGDKPQEFMSNPNGLINLIHYDDAARCVITALLKSSDLKRMNPKLLFLASDGFPMSKENICKAALMCPFYEKKFIPTFLGDKYIVDGKKYGTSLILKSLEWKPVFKSFEHFMSVDYDKEMNLTKFF